MSGIVQKNVVTGIPRFSEVISLTPTPQTPSLTIFTTPGTSPDILGKALVGVRLKDVTSAIDVIHEPTPTAFAPPFQQDVGDMKVSLQFDPFPPSPSCPHVIRISLHKDDLVARMMTPLDVVDAMKKGIKGLDGVHIACSCETSDAWFVRIRLYKITCDLSKSAYCKVSKNKFRGGKGYAQVPSTDSGWGRPDRSQTQNADEIAFDTVDVTQLGANVMTLINVTILDIHLGGVDSIKGATTRTFSQTRVNETGDVETANETVVDTDGTSLAACLAIEGVDAPRTFSNNICEVHAVLGLTAACNLLMQEIMSTLTNDGSYINSKHVQLLVDIMSCTGDLVPMSRHGVSRANAMGALSRCSFEETGEVLLKASLFGHGDNTYSPSPAVIFGQRPHLGTGAFDVVRTEMTQLSRAPRVVRSRRTNRAHPSPPRDNPSPSPGTDSPPSPPHTPNYPPSPPGPQATDPPPTTPDYPPSPPWPPPPGTPEYPPSPI
jgi:DNA-directed RNA polymerase II subunit RPB1